jgi:hypothetical protein
MGSLAARGIGLYVNENKMVRALDEGINGFVSYFSISSCSNAMTGHIFSPE